MPTNTNTNTTVDTTLSSDIYEISEFYEDLRSNIITDMIIERFTNKISFEDYCLYDLYNKNDNERKNYLFKNSYISRIFFKSSIFGITFEYFSVPGFPSIFELLITSNGFSSLSCFFHSYM